MVLCVFLEYRPSTKVSLLGDHDFKGNYILFFLLGTRTSSTSRWYIRVDEEVIEVKRPADTGLDARRRT